jgi:hypothetical protein
MIKRSPHRATQVLELNLDACLEERFENKVFYNELIFKFALESFWCPSPAFSFITIKHMEANQTNIYIISKNEIKTKKNVALNHTLSVFCLDFHILMIGLSIQLAHYY